MSCIVYGSVKCGNYNDMNYLLVTITHILITFTVAYYVLLNVAFYVLGISLSNFKLYHKNSVCVCLCVCVCVVCTQSFLTHCNPMDCKLLGSHGIFQARMLEWVAISYSTGSSQPRDQIWVSYVSFIGRQIMYLCATWGPQHKD